jgi:hypothetical protein
MIVKTLAVYKDPEDHEVTVVVPVELVPLVFLVR